ncbi:MAG: AEC family transporter, partial [Oscillospiraceae bacterium]|nr:AEC family transporter [Oscillospiraceae bacterium]
YFTRGSSKNTVRTALTHPCIIAVAVGIVLMMPGVQLPAVLERTISSLGACNTGLSMLLIGMIMHDLRPHDFIDTRILGFSAVRLVLIPLLVLTGCRIFHAETLASQVALLLVSMPAAGTTAVLAAKYGGDTAFAAGCVTVTTVLSLAAIPLWCMAMR